MRVVVDALPLRAGGGVTYARHQLTALAQVAPDLELHTLVSPWSHLDEVPGTIETPRLRHVPHRFAYQLTNVARREADVLYCIANFGPLAHRSPTVLVLHNAHYFADGLAQRRGRDVGATLRTRAHWAALKRADAVVAISQYLADAACEAVPAAADRVTVIPSGIVPWEGVRPAMPSGALPPAYILSVTSDQPHKRNRDVVRSWALAAARDPDVPDLVVVGALSGRTRCQLQSDAGPLAPRLAFVGRVAERGVMLWLYAHCRAFVSMSELESFSLTPLEARAAGARVVLSDIPVHREFLDHAALHVGVGDRDACADALLAAVRAESPGRLTSSWSWTDNARRTYDLFRSL